MSINLTKNLWSLKLWTKQRVIYPNAIMEEGDPNKGAFNDIIAKHLMKF